MKLNVRKARIFIMNIALFVILRQEGTLKYLFALGVAGMLLLLKNMRIRRTEALYFFLPWLFYILAGWGWCVLQGNINVYSVKQTVFYMVPLLLGFMVSACLKGDRDTWIAMQFWAILAIFLISGILNWGQGDLMESQYAFVLGIYFILFLWKKRFLLGVLAAMGLYLATKRIAILATVLTICFLLFFRAVRNEALKQRLLRVSILLTIGVPFLYIYVIRSGILEKLVYHFNIQTMGRLNIYGRMSEYYYLGFSYLGKGIGSARAIVESFGYEHYQLLHNDILSFYIELGFIGFLIFWIMYGAIFFKLCRKVNTDKMIILIAMFIYTVIIFMTDNISIYMNYFYPFYILFFSLLDKGAIPEEKKIGKTGFFNFNL